MPFTLTKHFTTDREVPPGYLFHETRLPGNIQHFLSEEKPGNTKVLPNFCPYVIPDSGINEGGAEMKESYNLWTAGVIAALGKLDHLKAFLSDRAKNNDFTNHGQYALEAAMENGHIEVVRYLLTRQTMSGQILSLAVQCGNLDIVKNLLSCPELHTYISDDLLYKAVESRHLEILEYLLGLPAIQQYSGSFNTDKHILCAALDTAARKNHVGLVEYFLPNVEVFSHAEIHEHEYGRYTHPFVDEKLTALRAAKAAAEEKNHNTAFDLNNLEEPKFYFYVIRNLIRRNPPNALENIRFLLSIPAVRALFDSRSILGNELKELLQVARENNLPAANILLQIPIILQLDDEMRENARHANEISENLLGRQNNSHIRTREAKVEFNFRAIARDRESSMTGLSNEEETRLKKAIERYQPEIKKEGVDKTLDRLCKTLEKRYNTHPARINLDQIYQKRDIVLPFSWKAFQKMKMDDEVRKKALEAYYQHPDHTAHRYLSKPNFWIHPQAMFIHENPQNSNEHWANFEDYKPLIAMLYLAAIDKEMKPTEGYTCETRLEYFIRSLALIGRAHNWDKTRLKKNNSNIQEEYDDLEGDRPSCFSGTKRRLFEAVPDHPLLNALTLNRITQELRDFALDFVKKKIAEKNITGGANNLLEQYQTYIISLEFEKDKDLESVVLIPKEEQDAFAKSLFQKYHNQFSKAFQEHVSRAFLNARPNPDQDRVNAITLGGGIQWDSIFKSETRITLDSVADRLAPSQATPFLLQQSSLATPLNNVLTADRPTLPQVVPPLPIQQVDLPIPLNNVLTANYSTPHQVTPIPIQQGSLPTPFEEISMQGTDDVFTLFPTKRRTRFVYPHHPIFFLLLSLFLAGLGVLGILPMAWGLWLAILVESEDVGLTIISRLSKSIHNLKNGRKQLKAILQLTAIILSLIGGALLGFFVLIHTPLFMTALRWVTLTSGTSFLMAFVCMTAGVMFALMTNKVNPGIGIAMGIIIGSLISLLLPIPVPLVVDAVSLAAVGSAFIVSVVLKQVLRAYYKACYGTSNADGYHFNHSLDENPTALDTKKAEVLGLSPEQGPKQVRTLRTICLNAIQGVKKRCHIGHDFSGSRWQLSNSFKDIYYLLTQAESNDDKENLKVLLHSSNVPQENEIADRTSGFRAMGMTDNTDVNKQLKFHKEGMAAAFYKLGLKQDEHTVTLTKFNEAIQPVQASLENNSIAMG